MSETPHATDIEVARSLNALTVTLNDQKADRVDLKRWQQIVLGVLGHEERIRVEVDAEAGGPAGVLVDAQTGKRVASFGFHEGRWTSSREGAPLSGGYIPK